MMKSAFLPRMTVATATVILVVALSTPATAEGITITWHPEVDKTGYSLDAGATRLASGTLDGGKVVIDPKQLLAPHETERAVTLVVDGHDELAVGLNLFRCERDCDWPVRLVNGKPLNSEEVRKICLGTPRSMETRYEQYFFCRATYQENVRAHDPCWGITMSALTGWFDSAYKLHELSLRDGIAFFGRDREVEEAARTTLDTCKDFETRVRRKSGYFRGMMVNLDVAVLARARRIERLLAIDGPDAARPQAEALIETLDQAPPLRSAAEPHDAAYVENVLNNAIPALEFTLR